MLKRLLLPTDGTPASLESILAGVNLARADASVIGLYVAPPFPHRIERSGDKAYRIWKQRQ